MLSIVLPRQTGEVRGGAERSRNISFLRCQTDRDLREILRLRPAGFAQTDRYNTMYKLNFSTYLCKIKRHNSGRRCRILAAHYPLFLNVCSMARTMNVPQDAAHLPVLLRFLPTFLFLSLRYPFASPSLSLRYTSAISSLRTSFIADYK